MAIMAYVASFAQTIDVDFSPLKTSLGKAILDGVQIVCFLFFIGGLIGAAWQYDKENKEAFKGFIYVIALTLIIGGGASIGKLAFLK